MKTVSPYNFVVRRMDGETKQIKKGPPEAYHDRLNKDRYDIAFEIEWETLTPTALNPCITTEKDAKGNPVPANIFGTEGEYAGYNNRWLMADGKLAISPFTVKSAIANGFAAIMGGCLRVMDDHKVSSHSDVKQGVYPYNGVWKRYRVARDGSSKPGIVVGRIDYPDGSRYFKLMHVREFYYDAPLPASRKWNRGDKVFITRMNNRGFKPSIITGLSDIRLNPSNIEVEYQGPCEADMYTSRKHHQHRFIERLSTVAEGILGKEHFLNEKALKKLVYSGVYKNDMNHPKPWFQNLSKLDKTDFVYYEEFNGTLMAIGQNFLFKALFYHPDTVPEGSEACTDMNHVCPRCSMFGMTNKNEKENEAVGFRGRFKSAALVNDLRLKKEEETTLVPVPQGEGKQPKMTEVNFQKWVNQADLNDRVSHQILMPVMGPPKPNKRDVDGYFNPATGKARGAKRYLHAKMNNQDLADYIRKVDGGGEAQMGEYKHELRPVAQVCREKLTFTGTVGAENCSVDEIAALVTLLGSGMDGMKPHAFKLGLGKALGMGTVRSSISKIFVRKPDQYEWDCRDCRDGKLSAEINSLIPGTEKALQTLKDVQEKLNLLEGMDDRKLHYPKAGLYYWKDFWKTDDDTANSGRQNDFSGNGRQSHGHGGTHGGGFHNTIRFTQNNHKKR